MPFGMTQGNQKHVVWSLLDPTDFMDVLRDAGM